MIIKRVGVLSFAKISGAIYAILGIIIGCLFALFSLMVGAIGSAASGSNASPYGAFFGVGAIIIFPIMYGIIGFVGGAISCALYNWLAGMIGGVEIDLQ